MRKNDGNPLFGGDIALPHPQMSRAMARYLEIYWLMIRNSLIREMSFKVNFLLWIIVELLWFAGQIIFIEVLYGYVDAIGDWSKWQMVLLVSTHQMIAQTFQGFFFVNLANFPELVRTGRLDLLLVLPMDSQFAASTRAFSLDSVIGALVSAGIVGFSLVKLNVYPSLDRFALFFASAVFGIVVHYAVMCLFATLSIWIVRAQGLVQGYFNLFNIGRYPDVVFRGVFKVIFTFIVPIILVANVPTRILARTAESPWPWFFSLLASAAVIGVLCRWFWQFAMRRYSSASS